jgi:proteasome activator subunit 4
MRLVHGQYSTDAAVHSWLLMRYPMPKSTRAKLVKLYYELCLLPGIDPRLMRVWTDIVAQLLANKPGQRRKLEAVDLQLPWRPLWRALQKELWPKKTIQEPLFVDLLLSIFSS